MTQTGAKLSAAFVRTVSKPSKYHDGGGTGLFLWVKSNGSRFWVQRITVSGKRREIGLGSPPTVTLAMAREQALENKRMVRIGTDPLQAKRTAIATPTFAVAAHEVHELHKPTWRNAKHAAQFIKTLETCAFPFIGDRKISEISTADVLRVLKPIWTEKPETARRVRQRIGTIMKWGMAQGWRQDNPAEAIAEALPRHRIIKAHRKALRYQEVAKCIEAVKASRATENTKLALEFLILTATRSGETRFARWKEINFEDADCATCATWTIPGTRMKAKRSHRIPLSQRAIDILGGASRYSDGSGLIFPGSKQAKPMSGPVAL